MKGRCCITQKGSWHVSSVMMGRCCKTRRFTASHLSAALWEMGIGSHSCDWLMLRKRKRTKIHSKVVILCCKTHHGPQHVNTLLQNKQWLTACQHTAAKHTMVGSQHVNTLLQSTQWLVHSMSTHNGSQHVNTQRFTACQQCCRKQECGDPQGSASVK